GCWAELIAGQGKGWCARSLASPHLIRRRHSALVQHYHAEGDIVAADYMQATQFIRVYEVHQLSHFFLGAWLPGPALPGLATATPRAAPRTPSGAGPAFYLRQRLSTLFVNGV